MDAIKSMEIYLSKLLTAWSLSPFSFVLYCLSLISGFMPGNNGVYVKLRTGWNKTDRKFDVKFKKSMSTENATNSVLIFISEIMVKSL